MDLLIKFHFKTQGIPSIERSLIVVLRVLSERAQAIGRWILDVELSNGGEESIFSRHDNAQAPISNP
jgi:hypothetical protein